MKQTIIIRDWHLVQRAKSLIDEIPYDPPHEVVIREYKSKRSTQANRYLWGVVYETIRQHISETTGQIYSAEDMHEAMKRKFLPAQIVEIADERLAINRSTAKLSTKEFAQYVDTIIDYAADRLNCRIPLPMDEGWYSRIGDSHEETKNQNTKG